MEHAARRSEDFNPVNPVGLFYGPILTMHETVSTDSLKELLESGPRPVILSVLDPGTHEKGHICDSVHIPLRDLERDVRSAVDKDELVVVYSLSKDCHKSAVATDVLKTLGYKRVLRYRGGIEEWKRSGQCVEGAIEPLGEAA